MELVEQGKLTIEKADLMRDISGNSANRKYGKEVIRQKLATCKYSAVAAVHAMILSGANYAEAKVVVKELIDMNSSILNSKDVIG